MSINRASLGNWTQTLLIGLTVLYCRLALHPFVKDLFTFNVPAGVALKTHKVLLATAVISGIGLSVWLFRVFLARSSRELVEYGPLRTFLLAVAIFWPLPMILDPGTINGQDWGYRLQAALLARDSILQGHFPGFSFLRGNGVAYMFQYPPLSNWVECLPMILGIDPQLSLKLVGLFAHVSFILGIYRLLLTLGFSIVPAAVAAAAVSLNQQYWMTGMLVGALPSWLAMALIAWAFNALVNLTRRPSILRAAVFGCLSGLIVMAHPIYAIFTFYLILAFSIPILWSNRQLLFSTLPWLLLSGLVAALVASPYLVTLVSLTRFNYYKPGHIEGFQFPPLVFLRTLIWSPRIGWPPGVGTDETGYIGLLLWSCCLLAPVIAWRKADSLVWKRSSVAIYVSGLALVCFLIFGTNFPGYGYIPYVYLNKGTYRLYPFLALFLATGAAFSFQYLSPRRLIFGGMIAVSLLEQLPFSTRPYFSSPDNVAEILKSNLPLTPTTGVLFLELEQSNSGRRVFRELALQGYPSLYYVHHEEIGVVGRDLPSLVESLQSPTCTDSRSDLISRLSSLGITHIVSAKGATTCPQSLGSARVVEILSFPITIVELQKPQWSIRRGAASASFSSQSDSNVHADGSVVLPVSYHPFLRAQGLSGQMELQNSNGLVKLCCFPEKSVELQLVFQPPFYLKALYGLSLLTLSLCTALTFKGSRSNLAVNHQ